MAIEVGSSGVLNFLRTGSYAIVTDPPFTVSCWAMWNSDFSTNAQSLFTLSQNGANPAHWYNINAQFQTNNKLRFDCSAANGAHEAISSSDIVVNEWFHVAAVVYAVDNRALFFNYTDKTTNTDSISPSGVNFTTIGAMRTNAYGWNWEGLLANLAVWDVALDDEEIKSLANGINPIKIRRDNLLKYYPLGGNNFSKGILDGELLAVEGTSVLARGSRPILGGPI